MYEAFRTSIDDVLFQYRTKLAAFEKSYLSPKSKHLTLMVVANELRETTRVVRVLHAILDQIKSFDREHEKPSDQVTHLLTILYKALQSSQSLSGNNAEHKTLWDLFVNTMLPYVSMIEDWIYDGILNDEIEESMIKEYVFLFT